MRAALVIARRILRQRLRDRSAIIFAVVTPLGLALAFASIIPDFTPTFHTTFAVVNEDGGQLSSVLIDDVLGHLVTAGIADIRQVPDEATARADVDANRAGAAIVIPAGFTTAIQAGTATRVRILSGESPTAREVARAAVARFASDIGTVQLAVLTVGGTGGKADAAALAAAQRAVQSPSPIAVTDTSSQHVQASLATFYGAAMAIMFVFFATQYGALSLLSERQSGTLGRLLAAPIQRGAIIMGGAFAGFVLGLVAMTVLVIATTLISHATWGPPPLVAALVLAAVFAAMGISALVATVARTTEQAGSINAIIAISLAAIGGVFIPLSQAPDVLATISLVTPHAWFLRAIDTLSGPAPTFVDILPSIAALLAMGVVTGAIGLARARSSLGAA